MQPKNYTGHYFSSLEYNFLNSVFAFSKTFFLCADKFFPRKLLMKLRSS